MMLSDAIRVAAQNGCDLELADGGSRIVIRAIGYDADPFELDERRLLSLSEEEFVRDWLPPRYEP